MTQNFLIFTRELERMQRLEAAGYSLYSPILMGDRLVAMTKFHMESEPLTATLKMVLAEKAENASLPLFFIQGDKDFDWFRVTPGNERAGVHLTAPAWFSLDELLQLFEYCRYR